MNEEDVVIWIFNRRNKLEQCKQLLSNVDAVIDKEHRIQQNDLICFLHDCYRKAVNKALKLTAGKNAIAQITPKSKNYPYYVKIIPMIVEHQINPLGFFSFIVEARRAKKIPCTIPNVVNKNSIAHYLDWQKKNTHRVSTYIQCQSYEKALYNQFGIDLVSLTTFLLRKPSVSLNNTDIFLLSSHSKALLLFNNAIPGLQLSNEEELFYEDLQFDGKFKKRVISAWNKTVDLQISKVESMCHELRGDSFQHKLMQIVDILKVLKVNG